MSEESTQIEVAKELQRLVFQKGSQVSWTTDYKKEYIKSLIHQHGLKTSQLPQSIVQKPVEEIIAAIEPYDPELKFFLHFYQQYEEFGTKQFGLYHLDPLSKENKTKILRTIAKKGYDLTSADGWAVVSCRVEHGSAFLTLSKLAVQPIRATLKRSDFNEEVWINIRETAQTRYPGSEKLLEVKATITAEKRTIVTIKLDLEDQILEIGADVFQSDTEGKRLSQVQIKADCKSALRVAAEHLGIGESGASGLIGSLDDTLPVIRKETVSELDNTNDESLLIIRTMEKFHEENIEELKLTEDAELSYPNQEIRDIMKAAGQHYDQHGSFAGFFVDNPAYKTDEAQLTRQVRDMDAPLLQIKAYAICSRQLKDGEASTFKGYMKGKKIDFVNFHMNVLGGEVEIKNGQYSERPQRIFLDRIIQLDRQTRVAGRPG